MRGALVLACAAIVLGVGARARARAEVEGEAEVEVEGERVLGSSRIAPQSSEDSPLRGLLRSPEVEGEVGLDEDDDLPSFGATARVAPIGVDAIDPSASGTTLSLRDRPRALETMDEILREAPGARARVTAGYGGFSSLSLRGADAEHTTVLLGELPLIAADGSAVDLSTLPPWMFERIEIYRGGAPLWLGASAIGGVLRLVPREVTGQRVELSLGAGSFDRYHGRAAITVGDRRLSTTTGVSVVSSLGAFPYVDDGGTAFDPSDDRERARQNAQLLEGSGLAHLSARVLDGRLSLIATGLGRTGGLSPPPSRFVDTPLGRRASQRLSAALSMDWLEGGRDPERAAEAAWRVSVAGGVGFEERMASDPLAQFGMVPRDTTDDLVRVHLRGAVTLRLADWCAATLLLQYAREELGSLDRISARAMWSARDLPAIGLEQRVSADLGDVQLDGRLSGRVEGVFSRLVEVDETRLGVRGEGLPLVTLRASMLATILRVLSITGSAFTAARAPSTLELFGDRGYLGGNVLLAPETSIGGDLGVVLTGSASGVRGRLELRGFYTHVDDLIRYQRTSQNQAVPRNVLDARLGGLEAGVSGDVLGIVHLHGALTVLDARDEATGRALPLRPAVVGYVRAEGHATDLGPLSRARVFVDLEHVSASTADPAALVTIPERTRLGLGVSLELLEGALRLDASVRDIFDARGYDVLGLPLPGRSFALELTTTGW